MPYLNMSGSSSDEGASNNTARASGGGSGKRRGIKTNAMYSEDDEDNSGRAQKRVRRAGSSSTLVPGSGSKSKGKEKEAEPKLTESGGRGKGKKKVVIDIDTSPSSIGQASTSRPPPQREGQSLFDFTPADASNPLYCDDRSPSPPPRPSTKPPPVPDAPSLSTFCCPICLGPPTPLAMTSCGHAFCAPCLHASLAAGPALTPPPPNRGHGFAGGVVVHGAGRVIVTGPEGVLHYVNGNLMGGPGVMPRAGGSGRAEESSELDKRCPVCRTSLRGGWGKSLRGLVLRMAPVRS